MVYRRCCLRLGKSYCSFKVDEFRFHILCSCCSLNVILLNYSDCPPFFFFFFWGYLSHHGFGICSDRLTMAQPLRTKIKTTGCHSNTVPCAHVPPGRPFSPSNQPWETQYAMRAAMDKVVGIGVPSKYLLFPVASFGKDETVTLNRARRDRPLRTKKVRRRVSIGVRRPRVNASTEGARPNDIFFFFFWLSGAYFALGFM